MKRNLIMFLFSCVSLYTLHAEYIDVNTFRATVLSSDVILIGNYTMENSYSNDYVTESICVISKIDSIIVNRTGFTRNSPIINRSIPTLSNCMGTTETMLIEEKNRHVDVLFLKQNEEGYEIINSLNSLRWDVITRSYLPLIKQLRIIEKIENLTERYSKTIDWYIDQGEYPNYIFIGFYKQKGILSSDTLVATDTQLRRALHMFVGQQKEKLLPFVKKAYPVDTYSYYRKKINQIYNKKEKTISDYLDFHNAIQRLYDFDYGTIEYAVNDLVTSENLTVNEKEQIMRSLISKVEKDLQRLRRY